MEPKPAVCAGPRLDCLEDAGISGLRNVSSRRISCYGDGDAARTDLKCDGDESGGTTVRHVGLAGARALE